MIYRDYLIIHWMTSERFFMSDFLQVAGVILIFGSILFLAWVTARIVGRKASASMQSRHMQVVEQISLGLDRRLILVRVGTEHFLFLAGKKEFRQVAKVNLEDTEAPSEGKSPGDGPVFDFRRIFDRYTHANDGKNQKTYNPDSEERKNDTLRRNIRRIEQLREKSYDKEV